MQSVFSRLQADVASRKQPRSAVWPAFRGYLLAAGLLVAGIQIGAWSADTPAGWLQHLETRERLVGLRTDRDALQGQVALQQAQIERFARIQKHSSRYSIGADLAARIEEIARAEGVDPALAFELIRVESGFNPRAVSPVGALGYTQLMPETARYFAPHATREQLFGEELNLRIGLRFFRSLLAQYDGDTRLALLAYNRGPATVDRLIAAGIDPANGYARRIMGR